MAVRTDPFDRLGRDTRDRVEAVVDRFRGGLGGDRLGRSLAKELRSIGFTDVEAQRHVELVIATDS